MEKCIKTALYPIEKCNMELNMERVLIKIAEKMKKDPSLRVFKDMYDFCREVMKTDTITAKLGKLTELEEAYEILFGGN